LGSEVMMGSFQFVLDYDNRPDSKNPPRNTVPCSDLRSLTGDLHGFATHWRELLAGLTWILTNWSGGSPARQVGVRGANGP